MDIRILILLVLIFTFCLFLIAFFTSQVYKHNPSDDTLCTIVTEDKTYEGVRFGDIVMTKSEPVSFEYQGKRIYASHFNVICEL